MTVSIGEELGELSSFAGGVLAIAGLTVAVAWYAGVRLGLLPVLAIVRAAAQLAVVALIVTGLTYFPTLALGPLAEALS